MNISRKIVFAVALLLTAAWARAGGLWISEFGSPSMGRASAGATSAADDASTALHNPASMSHVKDKQLMVTAEVIASEAKFEVDSASPINGTGNGGDAGGNAPAGSVFYTQELSEQWDFGIYVGGFTGAVLDYDDDWAGRFQAQEVSLVIMGAMPSVSYAINDSISIGIGVPVVYGELELDVALPTWNTTGAKAELDGDDVQLAANLSAFWKVSDTTRLGVQYQSKLDFEFGGNADIQNFAGSPRLGLDAELPLAAFAHGSLSHDFSDRFTGHLTVGWEEWSELESILLTAENDTLELAKDWDDIWNFAIGIEYEVLPEWTLSLGYRFDENPTNSRDRTADLPIDEQKRYAIGVQYEGRENFSLGAQLVYADYGDAAIDSSNSIDVPAPGPILDSVTVPTGFSGEFQDYNIIFFALNSNWKF